MKRALFCTLLIISILTCSLFAADYHDIALSFGQENYRWWPDGINVGYGMNLGLTSRLELQVWASSAVVPYPFKNNLIALELDMALIGRRSTASKIAGSGINTLIGIGGFYRTENGGAGTIISITPLTVGSPVTGKRERFLKTGVLYDYVNRELSVVFSLLDIDIYVRGTAKDYLPSRSII